jgi:Rab3 GTPase-activating protein catalytic subunit
MAEDKDVFEITDFTNATPWEGFVSGLENVIHQWGLDRTEDIYSYSANARQHRKSEKLVYGNKTFTITYNIGPKGRSLSSSSEGGGEGGKRVEEVTEEWTLAMRDLLDPQYDFPTSAHHISRWFGVQEFVVIATTRESESLISETQAKLVMSSVTIAAKNTGCATPIFVQIQSPWRQMYIGVCEGGGVRTTFDVIHLRQTPPPYNHLTGLLEVFKSKLEVGGTMPPVQVSVRFTYSLKHWNVDDWAETVDPQNTDNKMSSLPFGVTKDRVEELHLSTLWPHLTEEVVVDNSFHSDLTPLSAPMWTVRAKLSTSQSCLAGTRLGNFLKLAYCLDPIDQIVAGFEEDGVSTGGVTSTSSVLSKLTESRFESRFKGRRFLRSTIEAGMGRLQSAAAKDTQQTGPSSDELDEILVHLFPDAQEDSEPLPKVFKSSNNEDDGNHSLLKMKMSPKSSLIDELAFVICKVANKSSGAQTVAQVWKEVVEELRYRWENSHIIPNVASGDPDFNTCVLHQKFQMLNSCIRARKEASRRQREGASSSLTNEEPQLFMTPKSSLNILTEDKLPQGNLEEEDEEEDEFFEAQEEFVDETLPQSELSDKDRKESVKDSDVTLDAQEDMYVSTSTPKEESNSDDLTQTNLSRQGASHPYKDLLLLATGEPLFVPKTQDPGPLTEDMILEQEALLARLGTTEEAAKIRAKLQSGSLLSDMQAFKAANPGCLLEDFVRWYSPRDWIEGEEEEVVTSLPANTTSSKSTTGSDDNPLVHGDSEHHGEDDNKGDGWEEDDWDVVIEDSQDVKESGDKEEEGGENKDEQDSEPQQSKKYAVGHLSLRMQQEDSTWREAWSRAEPIPVKRQKKLFDATKEAEKVLHYLSSMTPSQLALQLIPNLFEHILVKMKEKLETEYVGLRCVQDIFTGLCELLESMYTFNLESLTKLQECVKLLEQGESLLAAADSITAKFTRGLETKGMTVLPEMTEDIRQGAMYILDNQDLLVKKSSSSPVSLALHGLLAAQIASQDGAGNEKDKSAKNEFPLPVGREYLLRCIVKCPTTDSTPTPQRMFAVITEDQFRIAGAFSTDSNAY